MNLQGKTVVFLGSSVTYGSASGGWSMCDYLAEKCGCQSVKWAVSGTTLADIEEGSYVRRLLSAMDSQETCDLFICQLSTNDASRGLEQGSIDSRREGFDTATVFGAMEFIIDTVRKKWHCPVAFYTGTRYESEAYQHMVDGLRMIAEKWNIHIIDLWDDPDMNSITLEDYRRYMSDPIHPNRDGYTHWWGPKFRDVLETL